jgi:hypothetical protein
MFTASFGLWGLDNYFQEAKFAIVFSLLGITSGIIFYYLILCPLITGLINYKDNNWSLPTGFIIGFLGISFGLGGYINKEYSTIIYCKDFKVERKAQGGGRHSSYYIYVKVNNKLERLESKADYWNSISEKENINLCIRKGKLGYNFVKITDE